MIMKEKNLKMLITLVLQWINAHNHKTTVEEAVVDHTVDAEEYVKSLTNVVEDMKQEEDKIQMESGNNNDGWLTNPIPSNYS